MSKSMPVCRIVAGIAAFALLLAETGLGVEREKSLVTGELIGNLAVAGRLDVDLHAVFMASRTFDKDTVLHWYNCGFSGGGRRNQVGGSFGDFGLHVPHTQRDQKYPRGVSTPESPAVRFDGNDIMKGNFTVEDAAADGEDLALEVWVRDAKTRMHLTHADETGRPAFLITRDGKTQTLRSSARIPSGQWAELALVLGGDTGILLIDGKTVARNDGITLDPDDLRATTCCVGRGLEGDFFAGELEGVSIYSVPLGR
ncbi:MAG: hypothetical protein IMZ44_08990 [Planctomycetes bacterium]|nr:hypothetical protein [Planctomycetota bacterium]